jgi:hypothetical protein
MTRLRDLPLAAKLGGAFGVLVLALVLVAWTGTRAMDGLRDRTDSLADRHLRIAELFGDLQMHAKSNTALTSEHLHVFDATTAERLNGVVGRFQLAVS